MSKFSQSPVHSVRPGVRDQQTPAILGIHRCLSSCFPVLPSSGNTCENLNKRLTLLSPTFPSCMMESVPQVFEPRGLLGGFNEGRHLGDMELVGDNH